MKAMTSALSSLLLCLACENPPPASTVRRDDLQLQLEPSDLSTGISGGPFSVTLVSSGGSFVASTAVALENAVSLVEWPSGRVVSTNVTSDDTHVRVSPVNPLTQGWYRLTLSPTDALMTFTMLDRWGVRETDLGDSTTFHVGHIPVLIATAENDSVDGLTTRVTISGSELLVAVAGTEVGGLLEVGNGAGAASCTYVMQTESPNGDLAYSDGLRFSCTGLDVTEPLTVRVHPGLTAVDGTPLRDLEGNTEAVASWTPSTDGRFSPHELSASSPLLSTGAP